MNPEELKKHLDDRTGWRSPDTSRESDRYLILQALKYINRLESELQALRDSTSNPSNPQDNQ